MRSLKRTLYLTWILMAGLLGALIGPTAIAYVQNPGGPTAVTVDLGKAMGLLDQRADAQRRIQALKDQRDQLAEDWTAKLKEKDTACAALQEGDSSGQAFLLARDELVHSALRFDNWLKYAGETIDHEASLLMRDLYREIKVELKGICLANGYDLVIRDDSIEDIPVDRSAKVPQEIQVMQAITSVQVLHATASADITAALVTRMNNKWTNSARPTQPAPSLAVPNLFDLPGAP